MPLLIGPLKATGLSQFASTVLAWLIAAAAMTASPGAGLEPRL